MQPFIRSPSLADPSFAVYYLGVIAIPIFFMVSGYLLLGRRNISYGYSLRKIWSIMRFVFLVVFIYWLYISAIADFNTKYLIYNFFGSFIQKGWFAQFWYFGTMIIIYLLLPFLNKLYHRHTPLILVCCALLILQNTAFVTNIIGDGEAKIIQTFRLWNWLTYFMLGGIMRHIKLNRRKIGVSILPLSFLTLGFITWLYPILDTNFREYFYSPPITVCLCCAIFYFVKSAHIKSSGLIMALSSLFLPVYALHILVINKTYTLMYTLKGFALGGILYFIIVLCLVMAICWLLIRIPLMRKIFTI